MNPSPASAPSHRFLLAALVVGGLVACGGPGGCACTGWTPEPQGTFTGPKLDSAGAARMSAQGFSVLNANSSQILALFAPGNQLVVPVDCSIQTVNLFGIPLPLDLAIADDGSLYCTAESCGQMDGHCDAKDLPHPITITITSLHFAPRSPDILEASITATVQTGKMYISTVSRSSALCLFSAPAKCGVDFDTGRAQPPDVQLAVNIRLAIDQRWDKLLRLEVADIAGSKSCGSSGALPPPQCIDPNDIAITNEGSCGACTAANFSIIKQLIVDQLTSSLKTQLDDALSGANCASCTPAGTCPTSPSATAVCEIPDGGDVDAGVCKDTGTGKCVPALLGAEGQLLLGPSLAAVGAPDTAGVELALGAGGSTSVSDAGASVGLRGGLKALTVAECVKPAVLPAPVALPLPDFDRDAPGPYDVAFSVSQQMLAQALFHTQQSGTLCLQLGTETVTQLDTSLLDKLLPSLGKLTYGEARPLLIVIRPVNPPTAVIGAGTVDAMGKPLDPLIRLDWQGAEIDVYAQLDDRMARLFTVVLNLKLPLGVTTDGCNGLTPIVGDLMGAVTVTDVKNSEILSEPLDVLKTLVPSLITFAEPALANGFQKFTLPDVQGFRIKLLGAQGVGAITGTTNFNHLGIYAQLEPTTTVCTPMKRAQRKFAAVASRLGAELELRVPSGLEVSFRVNGGFWSMPQRADSTGRVVVRHPALMLHARQVVELRTAYGEVQSVVLERDGSAAE